MPSAQDPFYVVKEEIQESVSFALMGWGLNFFTIWNVGVWFVAFETIWLNLLYPLSYRV